MAGHFGKSEWSTEVCPWLRRQAYTNNYALQGDLAGSLVQSGWYSRRYVLPTWQTLHFYLFHGTESSRSTLVLDFDTHESTARTECT